MIVTLLPVATCLSAFDIWLFRSPQLDKQNSHTRYRIIEQEQFDTIMCINPSHRYNPYLHDASCCAGPDLRASFD